MSWAFSIGDFLIADPTTEIPARAQEERKVELRPQNGPRLSEQHLPPINKEKRKERERERERERGIGLAKEMAPLALARSLAA